MIKTYEKGVPTTWLPPQLPIDPRLVSWAAEFYPEGTALHEKVVSYWKGNRLTNLKKHGLDPFGEFGLRFWKMPMDEVNFPNSCDVAKGLFPEGVSHLPYSEELVEKMLVAAEADLALETKRPGGLSVPT